MKKVMALVLIISIALCAAIGIHAYNVNKTRYWTEAYCEQSNGELIFTFCGESFVWTLGAGDTIPKTNYVTILMDNNGTEGFLEDDIIISFG